MEELGDARLRCDQLLRYLDEAVKLIEKSSHKDHFFEVAGHLIHSLPETAFKLQKALQAVALAADRIDYEEIKQELRPEKVEELERVLKDVRIRQVHHRSENPMKSPKQAAQRLRQFAKQAREEGSVPYHELVAFIHELAPSKQASDASVADNLDKIADQLEHAVTETSWGVDDVAGRSRLAGLLRYVAMEAEYNYALKLASKPRLTQELLQLSSVEEVKKKFKQENPDISDAELNEIAEQWQKNKDVVKDKTALDMNLYSNFETIRTFSMAAARAAAGSRWRHALVNLAMIVDEIGTILVRSGSMDTLKAEALKREIRKILPQAANNIEDSHEISVLANTPEEARRSRFEKNVPADPTQNMSPEDAKEWEAKNDEHEDKFKKEAGLYEQIKPGSKVTIRTPQGQEVSGKVVMKGPHGWVLNLGGPHGRPGIATPDNVVKVKNASKKKASKDEEKKSRYEEGKPADPTLNMSPEDAKEWEAQNDKHEDKFKAAGRTTHLEGRPGHTMCGEKAHSDTTVDSIKDATCYYCKQAWEKKHSKSAYDFR